MFPRLAGQAVDPSRSLYGFGPSVRTAIRQNRYTRARGDGTGRAGGFAPLAGRAERSKQEQQVAAK